MVQGSCRSQCDLPDSINGIIKMNDGGFPIAYPAYIHDIRSNQTDEVATGSGV